MVISTVLLDLDGVIRHFDSSRVGRVAARHGLTPDDMIGAAFSGDLLDRAVTGRLTRTEWVDAVGEAIGSREAAADLLSDRGAVDPEMVALIGDLRAGGMPVAILTNGTDTIPEELAELGIDDLVDRVFNTAELGVAKPDPAVYDHVCSALGLSPGAVFFTDDAPRNVDSACAVGLDAVPFIDAATLRRELDARLGPTSVR